MDKNRIEFNVTYDIKYSEYSRGEFDLWYAPWFGRVWIEVVGNPGSRAEMNSVVSKWKWLCLAKAKAKGRRSVRHNRKRLTRVRFKQTY